MSRGAVSALQIGVLCDASKSGMAGLQWYVTPGEYVLDIRRIGRDGRDASGGDRALVQHPSLFPIIAFWLSCLPLVVAR